MKDNNLKNGQFYLSIAEKAWNAMADLRRKRERNKNFTYGNQWVDTVRDEFGNVMTEYDYLRQSGREPLTNNLIRQLVKSVVGRFRNSLKEAAAPDDIAKVLAENDTDELDCRALEEFLISGCCFQKIERYHTITGAGLAISNISPSMVFLNATTDPCGRDCRLIGQLHEMTFGEIIHRLADGNRRKAIEICNAFGIDNAPEPTMASAGRDGVNFHTSGDGDKLRIVELWTLESRECYECHDTSSGRWFMTGIHDSAAMAEGVKRRWTLKDTWRCRWITPNGTIVSQYDSPLPNGTHPYVFKLYPLTDGEVHSLVEDVIDQQKYVNRLITLVEHIMSASAKGVLLFPESMLPTGYTWDDLKHAWATPGSIIPYRPRNIPDRPQQITASRSDAGAYEMLGLQMKLFEQVSGVSGALQGQSANATTGAQLYESQIRNSTVALSDIFESFNSFRRHRNALAAAFVRQGL